MLIYHNIVSAGEIGVTTQPLVELDDADQQFEEGKGYEIGILDVNGLTRSKKCTSIGECFEQVYRLEKILGKGASIFFRELVKSEPGYVVLVKGQDDIAVTPGFESGDDQFEIMVSVEMLTADFDYNKMLSLVFSRNSETKRLYLQDISYSEKS